jgi:hypothetical protein
MDWRRISKQLKPGKYEADTFFVDTDNMYGYC